MLPLNASIADLDRYVHNIIGVWGVASTDQIVRGRNWYRTANDLATLMAEGDTRRGAGVIAALSPQSAWELNVKQAGKALSAGTARGLHTGNAIGKAEAIMAGADPLDVLPTDSKTWNFYRCIINPEDEEAVVIDRHAHDIVAGVRWGSKQRGLGSAKRYALIALAYRTAGQYLNERPSVVQAVTWVVWREMWRDES